MQKLSRTLSATDNPKNSDYVLKQPKLHPKPKFFRFTFNQLFDHSSEAAGFFSYKEKVGIISSVTLLTHYVALQSLVLTLKKLFRLLSRSARHPTSPGVVELSELSPFAASTKAAEYGPVNERPAAPNVPTTAAKPAQDPNIVGIEPTTKKKRIKED